MNIVFTPYGWEWRIREGQLRRRCCGRCTRSTTTSPQFAGGKVIWVLLYLPIAVGARR